MKRLVLTVTGTVAGLAALLSFKTQTHPVAASGALPSAGTSSTSAGAVPATRPAGSGAATSATATAPAAAAPAAPKTYTGQAISTRYGIVQVKATVANGKITDVAFVQLTAFDGRSQQINSQAAPVLLRETLQNQTAQVDTVSGASYTSDGYRESLQSALDKAGLK